MIQAAACRPRAWLALALALALGAPACGADADADGTRDAGAARVLADTTPGGLYYEVGGAGEAVVLIHGFSLDLRMWEPQVSVLRQRYRVVRYDLRGHGRSAGWDGPFAAHEDLAAVLDAAGIERATLVGLSAGAQIAVDFALARPDRVTRLVLASPGLGGYVPRDPFDWMMPVIEAARSGDVTEAARRFAASRLMAIPANPAGDSLMRRIVMDNARIWSVSANPERPLDPPAIARLGEIRVPVLIVVGAQDLPDIGRIADTLAACIPTAGRVVLPDAGHMVNLALPDFFTDALLSFLARPTPRHPPADPPC